MRLKGLRGFKMKMNRVLGHTIVQVHRLYMGIIVEMIQSSTVQAHERLGGIVQGYQGKAPEGSKFRSWDLGFRVLGFGV